MRLRNVRGLVVVLLAAVAPVLATSLAAAQTPPPQQPATPPPPAAAAQPATGQPPPAGTDAAASDPTRTSQSRVIDTGREDVEREQGQTERDREAAIRRQEQAERDKRNHRYQVGVRIGFAMPYRFRLEYGGDDAAQCEPMEGTDETFCSGAGEPSLDLGLEFGVTETLELLLLMRIGMTSDEFTDASVLNLGIGLRAYLNATDLVKPYFGAALVMDLGSSDNVTLDDAYGSFDFGLRGAFGVQFDVIRYLGIYVQVGAQLAFLRYLETTIDGSVGLQGRFP